LGGDVEGAVVDRADRAHRTDRLAGAADGDGALEGVAGGVGEDDIATRDVGAAGVGIGSGESEGIDTGFR